MLVLTRKPGEKVVIGDCIVVSVVEVKGIRVRVGIEAPDDVRILRAEIASPQKQWPPISTLEVGTDHRLADPESLNHTDQWALAANDFDPGGDNHFEHGPRSTRVGSADRLTPKSEKTGTVKIVTFTAGKVRRENVIATELEGLTDDLGECHLLLDFTNVEYITSVELETLLSLHKKMAASGGRLTLFNLSLKVFEVFTATHLENLIGICR